ncbi:MAG TPA: SHOCT domain-containing protein [Thermomicrobiales bacterium]|nr:SHOCT domain-containing protein [Thermomicrobiales bacterium]
MHALALVQPVVAHAGPYYGGPGGFWFGGPIMFLFWIAILFLAFRFFTRGGCRWRNDAAPQDRARDILADRYARGEIDAEEYRQRSETLIDRQGPGSSPVTRAGDMFTLRSARAILAERYARGEIDAEEFRTRSETLR